MSTASLPTPENTASMSRLETPPKRWQVKQSSELHVFGQNRSEAEVDDRREPEGWSDRDIKKRVRVALCHSPELTHLACDRPESPCDNAPSVRTHPHRRSHFSMAEGKPVWPVVWGTG